MEMKKSKMLLSIISTGSRTFDESGRLRFVYLSVV